jgi:hypothetical protein
VNHIRNTKDFYAGLVYIFFGTAAMAFAPSYQIGTAARMGPGYFPFVLGGMLAMLGLVVLLRSISRKEKGKKGISFRKKQAFLVISSIVLFGLLLRPLGLLLSTLILVLISSMASYEFKMKAAILNAFVLLIIVLIIFVYFLKFQIPIWPSFLAGRT